MGISNTCGELINEDNPIYLVGGIPTPLKNMMKVSWDDDIPNICWVDYFLIIWVSNILVYMEKMFQTTNQ